MGKAIFKNLMNCINLVNISNDKVDKLVWKEDSRGVFSSSSFYNFCLSQNGVELVHWAKFL